MIGHFDREFKAYFEYVVYTLIKLIFSKHQNLNVIIFKPDLYKLAIDYKNQCF